MKFRALPAKTPYTFLLALALTAAMTLASAFAPAPAQAAENVAYVKDSAGKTTYYTDTNAAVSAAYGAGNTLVLLRDWRLNSTLYVADSKELTIDMNGHSIAFTDASAGWNHPSIRMYEHSKLTLKSSATARFEYEGNIKGSDGKWTWTKTSITAGGLIFNDGRLGGSGISMDADCTLTVTDGVAIAGCSKSGIETKSDCTVNLNKGAIVTANAASSSGAGIELGNSTKLNMNNAKIVKNESNGQGGGVYAGSGVEIYLENGSQISENEAYAGGGVYLNYSKFTLESKDGTGEISKNVAAENGPEPLKTRASGGGIHVDQVKYSANQGLIKNLKITDNYSYWDGGAIELDQQNTTIEGCTITGNGAYYEGGGVYVCNKNNVIKDTVIQGNYCNDCDSNYEGGGVYVWCDYDIELQGTVNITGNTRGYNSSNPDNLFLRDNAGSTARAYIKGSVSKDSKIGVRTGITGDRRIGKSIENNDADSFYMDLSGYYVSYGSDEGGDMWQRTGEVDYAVTLNGKSLGRYKPGAMVTVNGETSTTISAFLSWSEKSTGLAPFSDYFTNVYYSKVTFYMPKNDVHLVTDTIGRTSYATLTLEKPTAGDALPTTGTLSWGSGQLIRSKSVELHWLDEGGAQATSAVYGAKYRFYVIAPENRKDEGLAFSSSIDASHVEIHYADSTETLAATDAHVDYQDALNVTSDFITMEMPAITEVESTSTMVMAGTTRNEFIDSLPDTATAKLQNDSWITLATDKDATIQGLDQFIDMSNGKVKEPEGGVEWYTIKVPLVASDKVATVEGKYLEIQVTVIESAALVPPSLSPCEGTYEGTSLTLTATAGEDATIKYKVDGGGEQTYDAAAGIVLTGVEDKKVSIALEIWSVAGSKESTHITVTYTLDDSLAKRIVVNCSDTALYNEGDTRWSAKFYVTSDVGRTVTVTAPVEDGRVFDHWEWADAPEGTDLSNSELEIKDFSPNYDGGITAVYTPVITAVDLVVGPVPAAHELLPQGAQYVKIKSGSDDSWTDVTSYFSTPHGAATITWSPAGDEEGKADHLTTYVATLKMEAGGAAEGVKYTLADNLDLWVNDEKAAEDAAWVSKEDGARYLNAQFPATGAYIYSSLDSLDDVNISFEDAAAAQAGTGDWGLPSEVGINFACGEEDLIGVEWGSVEGFDPTSQTSQTLKVTGTVSYPDSIDATGAPKTVEITINVAAPEQVEAPSASLASGTYAGTQGIELSCGTEEAVIRYTTDGSDPTAESAVYDDPIEISHSTQIRAQAFRDGWKASEVSTFSYVITHQVTFDSAKGSAVADQTVEDGACATRPADPTRDGYDFVGWYTAEGEVYDFDTPVTGDLTLTASWEKKDSGSDTDPDDPDDDPDVTPDDPDVTPDDGKGDKGDEDGKGDKGDEQPDAKKDDSSKRKTLPGTGDASAVAGIAAAAGVALAACGARRRNR